LKKKHVHCGSRITKKNGVKNFKQLYKCYACSRQFVEGFRLKPEQLWDEFFTGKQTYSQLGLKYNCSTRTIQRKLDRYASSLPKIRPRSVVVLMDTVYWGRDFGVMVFRDALTRENLLKYYVKTETNDKYREGINELASKGFTVKAIVCDGRRGLLNSFIGILVQMCQFHQVAIVRRYITKNLNASLC